MALTPHSHGLWLGTADRSSWVRASQWAQSSQAPPAPSLALQVAKTAVPAFMLRHSALKVSSLAHSSTWKLARNAPSQPQPGPPAAPEAPGAPPAMSCQSSHRIRMAAQTETRCPGSMVSPNSRPAVPSPAFFPRTAMLLPSVPAKFGPASAHDQGVTVTSQALPVARDASLSNYLPKGSMPPSLPPGTEPGPSRGSGTSPELNRPTWSLCMSSWTPRTQRWPLQELACQQRDSSLLTASVRPFQMRGAMD